MIPGASCGSNSCGRPLVGCVAVAMGQVIRYWGRANPNFRTSFNYDWANLPEGRVGGVELTSSETHRLLYDAGDKVGMSWGCQASGAYSTNIPGAMKSGFGYSSANHVSRYRSQDVINNLNMDWPVILAGCTQNCSFLTWQYGCGSCHAWVCDGYKRTEMPGQEYCYYDCVQQTPDCYECYTSIVTYDQLHMKWGWFNGNHDGWFASTNFSYSNGPNGQTMPHNFNSDLSEIVDIHP